ncbi:MAG: hypothetical protein ABFS56_23060 [Pseudomonadota bacterium]
MKGSAYHNAISCRKNIYYVGWVERSETHQLIENGGFCSALPTISLNLMALSAYQPV